MNKDLIKLQEEFHKDALSSRFRNRLINPYLQTKEKKLASLVKGKMEGGRLLEVGCGEGSNLVFLIKEMPGVELVGIDFSKEKAQFVNRHVKGAVSVCGDATLLPFTERAFDLVLMRDLLHHTNWAREQVLEEAVRVLKPGGAVVVIESDGSKLLNRAFQLVIPAERGMKDSTPEKLMQLCKRFGAVELEYVEASFMIRTVGYIFGWREGALRYALIPLYVLAKLWERTIERLRPRSAWTYMMFCIRRTGPVVLDE